MTLTASVQTGMVESSQSVVVFACGEPLRGDDSIAHLAVKSLPADAYDRADVKLIGALQPEYLVAVEPGVRVVIVDAVVGPPPGEIVFMDLAEMSGRAESVVTTSTHQLPLDQVVALAQLLRDEPLDGVLVGVGIEAVAEGTDLSDAVQAALPGLRRAVSEALEPTAGR